MASNPPRKPTASLPPRRGRVKAQIFESLAGNLSSVAAKASLVLAKAKGGSSAAATSDTSASTSASASASASPPASAYASDGCPDHA